MLLRTQLYIAILLEPYSIQILSKSAAELHPRHRAKSESDKAIICLSVFPSARLSVCLVCAERIYCILVVRREKILNFTGPERENIQF